jgi:hypothetical protein
LLSSENIEEGDQLVDLDVDEERPLNCILMIKNLRV